MTLLTEPQLGAQEALQRGVAAQLTLRKARCSQRVDSAFVGFMDTAYPRNPYVMQFAIPGDH